MPEYKQIECGQSIDEIKRDGLFLGCVKKYFPPDIIIPMNHETFVKCRALEEELCNMVLHLGLIVRINMGSRIHINVDEKKVVDMFEEIKSIHKKHDDANVSTMDNPTKNSDNAYSNEDFDFLNIREWHIRKNYKKKCKTKCK